MNFFKPKETPATAEAPPSPPQQLLHQAFTSLQTHFSNFIQNLQTNRPLNNSFYARISNENNTFYSKSSTSSSNDSFPRKNYAMSDEDIQERLAGVPVYALTDGSRDFVFVSDKKTDKFLGLFCVNEADAETLRQQMKSMDPSQKFNAQVVAVSLGKILDLKDDGVALRLIPEPSQIKNAVEERERAGIRDKRFIGVPVFQAKSLILRNQNKRYLPVFLRKEDLENSLSRASRDQNHLNPILRQGEIQVAVLEEIIQAMKDSSMSSWNDVVFIPPGFDVSTDPSRLGQGN